MFTVRRSRATAWLLTPLALASLLIAACGDDSGAAETAATSAASTSTAAATEATPANGTAETTATTAATEAGAATEITIEHYSGTDTVPVNPETVVVMDVGVLLTMDALGIDGVAALGGLGTPIPAEFEAVIQNPAFADVGSAFEPDYEAINALEPDLIIVATRSSATYPEMSRIAPTIDLTLPGEDYVAEIHKQVTDLGRIFGVEEAAATALAELDAEIAAVQAETADAGTALIVMTSGAEVSAYGPGSRFGIVHDVFGYAPADESLERDATHGDVIAFEFILEAAPDALFVVDRSAAIGDEAENAQAVLDNELVRQTPAWQNDRVVYTDGFAWYIATNSLPSFHAMLEDVRASLG